MKTLKTRHALLASVLSLVLCIAMLTSTTFAWFTDTAVSASNKIVAGTLKVDLEVLTAEGFKSIKEKSDPIFNYEKWEPGYTEVKVLKIENEGSLALKWVAKFVSEKALSELANVIDVYVLPSATEIAVPTDRNLAGYTKVGTVADFVNSIDETTKGVLKAQESAYLGIALKMREDAGNEYQGKDLGGAFDIAIFATQQTFEKDTIDDQYDAGAYLPTVYTLAEFASALEQGASVKLGESIAAEKSLTVSAGKDLLFDLGGKTIEGSFELEAGAKLTLANGEINNADSTASGIQNNGGDLTINDVNIASARHAVRVEGGTAVINGGTYKTVADSSSAAGMTQHALNVSDGAEVIINDGTFIGPKGTSADSGSAVNVQAGSTVTIYGGNFSGGKNKTLSANGTLVVYGGTFDQDPSAYVPSGYAATKNDNGTWTVEKLKADKWDGTADTDWYDPTNPKTEYSLSTAEQLAGLAELVTGNTTFAGVTITLTNDIDLYCEDTTPAADGDPLTFRPIGDHKKGGTFEGTFDGNGKTISNLYQNGWDLGYEWGVYGSYGLFGNLNNATVKNLTIEGSESYIEGGDTSFVAGSATGTCVFENITIEDSISATYNNGNGGIIGWSGDGNYTFKNINIKEDCVLAGLWGSFDSSIGGVVGQAEPGATYNFENVNVACRIDAYNDCTASYDYYNYRMCGMLIGRLEETTTIDGSNYPDTSKYIINCNNVTVTYGDWANYHYCRATGARAARVEAGYSYGGIAADYDHSACTAHHNELIEFDQIFGGDQYAVKGLKAYAGVKVVYNNK